MARSSTTRHTGSSSSQRSFDFGKDDTFPTAPGARLPALLPDSPDPVLTTARTQRGFDFMKVEALPRLSPAEQRALLERFVARHDLNGLNLSRFQVRPTQIAAAEPVLEHADPSRVLALEADTGSGKTPLFILRALKEHSAGRRSILVTPRLNLEKQVRDMIGTFVDPGHLTVQACTGNVASDRRLARYTSGPDILIITPNVLLNDMSRIDWRNVGVIMYDEPQLDQRRDGRLHGVERVRERHPMILQVLFSATLAETREKLVAMLHSIGPHRLVKVCAADKLPPEALVNATTKPVTIRKTVHNLPLDPALSPLMNAVREEIIAAYDSIKLPHQQKPLFKMRRGYPLWVPAHEERERVRKLVNSSESSDSDLGRNLMNLAETDLWAGLFKRGTQLGRFAFLERFFYIYAKRHIQPGLFLSEIEGAVPKEKRGRVSGAAKQVTGSSRVLPLIEKEVAGTPYAALLELRTWDEIMERCEPLFAPESLGTTSCAERRRLRLESRNKFRADPQDETPKARLFFDSALRFMAHREQTDSVKLIGIRELLDRHLGSLTEGRSFIFTTTQRQADFLAEAIEARFSEAGMKPVSIHSDTPKRQQREGMAAFKEGRFNILTTTMDYAGTGLDVPAARLAIMYTISSARAVLLQQAEGRVEGRADEDAFIYYLATRGTFEQAWYDNAQAKAEERDREVRARAEVIYPSFVT